MTIVERMFQSLWSSFLAHRQILQPEKSGTYLLFYSANIQYADARLLHFETFQSQQANRYVMQRSSRQVPSCPTAVRET